MIGIGLNVNTAQDELAPTSCARPPRRCASRRPRRSTASGARRAARAGSPTGWRASADPAGIARPLPRARRAARPAHRLERRATRRHEGEAQRHRRRRQPGRVHRRRPSACGSTPARCIWRSRGASGGLSRFGVLDRWSVRHFGAVRARRLHLQLAPASASTLSVVRSRPERRSFAPWRGAPPSGAAVALLAPALALREVLHQLAGERRRLARHPVAGAAQHLLGLGRVRRAPPPAAPPPAGGRACGPRAPAGARCARARARRS